MTTETRRVTLPMMTREAPLGAVDVEARTADVVWTTGAAVRRYSWQRGEDYWEELSLDPAHVRLQRLRNGAPLLNAHNAWSLDGVIGVVERVELIPLQRGEATVRFSERAEVDPIFRDVQAKIIRNVSHGYVTHRLLDTGEVRDGLPVYRAIDWEPMELSFVPIGADPNAGTRAQQQQQASQGYPCDIVTAQAAQLKEPNQMDEQTRAASENAAQNTQAAAAVDLETVRAEAIAAERARVTRIGEFVRAHPLLTAEDERAWVDGGVPFAQMRGEALEKLVARQHVIRRSDPYIDVVSDETVNLRSGNVEALLHRYDPARFALTDNGRRFRGLSLLEMSRESLQRRGINTSGLSRSEIATRVFQSGADFPAIVGDVSNKSVRLAYDSAPRTFTPWARRSNAPDFKSINRVQLSDAPQLLKVLPGAEISYGAFSDSKESYALATYARIAGINRQTIINDDVQAFTRIPAALAAAAARLESDTVYAVLTANANMADGVALFATAATRGNLAASGAAISVTSLGVGRAAVRKQTAPNGDVLNLSPSFLLVPTTQEALALQYTSADFVAAKSSDINPFKAGGATSLQPIVEPRLDANSTTAWYLVASPSQIDTVEYCYLEGDEGVMVETRIGFEVDGMEIKVRLDFAAAAIEFRGLYKNPGA